MGFESFVWTGKMFLVLKIIPSCLHKIPSFFDTLKILAIALFTLYSSLICYIRAYSLCHGRPWLWLVIFLFHLMTHYHPEQLQSLQTPTRQTNPQPSQFWCLSAPPLFCHTDPYLHYGFHQHWNFLLVKFQSFIYSFILQIPIEYLPHATHCASYCKSSYS